MAFIKQVRGDDDRIYLKFCSDVALLDSSPPKFIRQGKEKLDMYDFFICHASEDKESIARPLSDSLKSKGAKVFIDEDYIQLGDSFVQKINHALGRSRHIVAVISSNSYRKHWPATELRSVLAMEATEGNKLLPIMVGNNTEVERFLQELPLLSHRLYHQWDPASDSSENVQKAIDELLRVWSPPGTERD